MAIRRNQGLGGGAGTILSGAWGLYANFTTAKDLPDDAGWVARMLADPPVYAPWLLFVACVAFLVWVFWHRRSDSAETDGDTTTTTTPTATTSGDHSPAFAAGAIHGGTFNFGPPPPPPAPVPTSPWDDPTFSLNEQPKSSQVLPDMELREVCGRLYNSLGGPTQLIDEFERRVDLEIKDNVRHRRLHTWGRKKPGEALDDVWSEAWLKGDFSHKLGLLSFRHPDNPTHTLKWSDLRFCRREVDKWLPPPKEPPYRRPDLGPNGWMA